MEIKTSTCKDEDMAHLRQVFATIDRNDDGEIDIHELQRFVGNRISRSELVTLIQSVDQDGDMRINFDEFVEFMSHQQFSASPQVSDITDVFSEIDVDGSGTLDKGELRQLMLKFGHPMSDSELDCIMKEADKDGDGVISLQEFLAIMV